MAHAPRFQDPAARREGNWWYLLYWQDTFSDEKATRKRKRHGGCTTYLRLDLLRFAISTTFRGTCTSRTCSLPFSRASTKIILPFPVGGVGNKFQFFPVQFDLLFLCIPITLHQFAETFGFRHRSFPFSETLFGELNLCHTVNLPSDRWKLYYPHRPPPNVPPAPSRTPPPDSPHTDLRSVVVRSGSLERSGWDTCFRALHYPHTQLTPTLGK